MENFNDYRYLGNTLPEVPKPWEGIVLNMLKEMDKAIRPWYIPRRICNLIKDLSTTSFGVVQTNYFWYNILQKITKSNIILSVKSKYGSLRVYGNFDTTCNLITVKSIIEARNTCEYCGGQDKVAQVSIKGWVTNLCQKCTEEFKHKKKNGGDIGSSISD